MSEIVDETWVLKESIIQRLSVCERKILRKIFGQTNEDNGIWRIKTNKELNELINYWNIINYLSQYLTNLMQKICFTISFISWLSCFEHMCSSSGGQKCIAQPLVSSHL